MDESRRKKFEITPEMVEAGVTFLKDFFPAEWGSRRGITDVEAKAVVEGILAVAAARHAVTFGRDANSY